jgi:hypothetical protein
LDTSGQTLLLRVERLQSLSLSNCRVGTAYGQSDSREGSVNPCKFGNVLHDNLTIRLGENDAGGAVVVVSNPDAGLVLLFSVSIPLDDMELIQRGRRGKKKTLRAVGK